MLQHVKMVSVLDYSDFCILNVVYSHFLKIKIIIHISFCITKYCLYFT